MDPTYFTCTLGQAAELKNQQSVQNVNEFVEAQAKTNPDRPAVGFYTAPSSSKTAMAKANGLTGPTPSRKSWPAL
jgi:hypothetical protein